MIKNKSVENNSVENTSSEEDKSMVAGISIKYTIMDLGRRAVYIPITWLTRKEANIELAELLKPFSEDSVWRKRLVVKRSEDIKRNTNAPTAWDSTKWRAEKNEEIRAIEEECQIDS